MSTQCVVGVTLPCVVSKTQQWVLGSVDSTHSIIIVIVFDLNVFILCDGLSERLGMCAFLRQGV